MRHADHARHPLIAPLALVIALFSAGCASSREAPPEQVEKPVTAADFADASITRTPTTPTPPPTIAREKASVGSGDIKVSVAAPEVAAVSSPPAVGAEQTFVVDQMVGQVNGKPIYADEFFEEMDARLRQEASRLPLDQWVSMVRDDVARKLWDQTRDQLLLSEFQTTLTPEQKMGVRAFIEDLRQNIQRSYGGSSEVANEKLQQEEGVTLRQKVQNEADQQFILAQLRSSIAQRVQVSFKDISLYYQQNYDRFHPAPVAMFRVIRVSISSTRRMDGVETALLSGESPVEIAAKYSDWAKEDENIHRVEITDHDYAKTTFWGAEALNKATQALKPGEITPRIDIGGRAWWVYLETIDAPPAQDLYEAQLEIEKSIRAQRISEEERRYFRGLVDRSNMTQFDDMVKRLVAYAAERYYVRELYKSKEEQGGEG